MTSKYRYQVGDVAMTMDRSMRYLLVHDMDYECYTFIDQDGNKVVIGAGHIDAGRLMIRADHLCNNLARHILFGRQS